MFTVLESFSYSHAISYRQVQKRETVYSFETSSIPSADLAKSNHVYQIIIIPNLFRIVSSHSVHLVKLENTNKVKVTWALIKGFNDIQWQT